VRPHDALAEVLGFVLSSVVEYEDELTPGCTLNPRDGRSLAHALVECADRIEGK
jgi:hypothetical protein